MNKLHKRILEISYKNQLSHIGSCLITVDTLDHIYKIRGKDDPVILSNGHAGLALYVVLEKYFGYDAEMLFEKHGVHPNRDVEHGIWASGGSLGSGITLGVGYALSDRKRIVYVVGSDGDVNEGSWYEALRIAADCRLENLRISIICNVFGAYSRIDTDDVDNRLNVFYPTLIVKKNLFEYPLWIQGQVGHYVSMTKEQYKEVMK